MTRIRLAITTGSSIFYISLSLDFGYHDTLQLESNGVCGMFLHSTILSGTPQWGYRPTQTVGRSQTTHNPHLGRTTSDQLHLAFIRICAGKSASPFPMSRCTSLSRAFQRAQDVLLVLCQMGHPFPDRNLAHTLALRSPDTR